jgi:hypothetical protein
MERVRPKVHACFVRYREPGTALVRLRVAETGRVVSAVILGKFANTATGKCVELAVLTAEFPRHSTDIVDYPFHLP